MATIDELKRQADNLAHFLNTECRYDPEGLRDAASDAHDLGADLEDLFEEYYASLPEDGADEDEEVPSV